MDLDLNTIPDSQPLWYNLWQKKETLSRLFPDLIRLHYIRSKKPQITNIKFSENGFTAALDGHFKTTWTLNESTGQWSAKCSCNYPKQTCVHAWYLVLILEFCARTKNWTPSIPQNNATTPTPEIPPTPKISAPNIVDHNIIDNDQYLVPLFSEAPLPTQLSINEEAQQKELQIEADFNLNPGSTTLRFYEVTDGMRKLLRMQSVFNISQQLNFDKTQGWNDKDISFFQWLRRNMEDKNYWRENLQVLKLSNQKFDEWFEYWKHQPDRFIDKETQKPIAFKLTASIHFELFLEEEKIRIKAFVSTSLENKEEFHKVFPTIREQNKCLLNGVFVKLTLPISWQTLVDCFSKKSPTMPKAALTQHLPTILENRLDLIQGNNISRQTQKFNLTLKVIAYENFFSFVAVDHLDKVVNLETNSSNSIYLKNNQFIINNIDSPVFDAIKHLSHQIDPESPENKFNLNPKNIEKLYNLWRELDIPKLTDEKLANILSSPAQAQFQIALKENKNWLDYSLSWKINNLSLSHEEMKTALAERRSFVRNQNGDWLHLDLDEVTLQLNVLEELEFHQSHGKKLKFEGKKLLALLQNPNISQHSRELAKAIRAMPEPPALNIPEKMAKILRNYQNEGVQFIHSRLFYNLGIILADDMGLGKTLQTLSLIASTNFPKPVLVIAPASVVYVWQDEIKKFIPELKSIILQGSPENRQKILNSIENFNLVITNYHIVRNDLEELKKIDFSLVILDEAQMIKNPHAIISQSVKNLKSDKRLALSGTPVENRLTDLWSIFDFLTPGFLGRYEDFVTHYETNPASRKELATRVRPLILRRTKEKVAKELPPRMEEIIRCEMTPEQQALYKKIVAEAKREIKIKKFSIFTALLRLRQVCCDPTLLGELFEKFTSSKLDTLIEMLQPVIEEGHSVLVFSQFTSMLEKIDQRLEQLNIKSFTITGATPSNKRPEVIAEFNACPQASVFLLSLKAAGTGLTLTKADYVFIYDPWWNPAAEQQAIDRAHRIGQDKPVFVYKMVTKNSVEEKIIALQQEKKILFNEVINEDEIPTHFSADELAGLLDD